MIKETRRLTVILVMFAIAAMLAGGFYVFEMPASTA